MAVAAIAIALISSDLDDCAGVFGESAIAEAAAEAAEEYSELPELEKLKSVLKEVHKLLCRLGGRQSEEM